MELSLVRHTAVQAPGICYGHYDVPLADTFAAEVATLRTRLPPASGQRVFSSPALRCLTLAAEFTTDITPDERLREMHFGTWENRAWNELPPAETASWMADYVTLAPPGGETFGAVQQRTAAFLAELTAGQDQTPALLFTHGGTIRAILCHCLEIPLRNAFQLRIDFASITRLHYQHERWNLSAFNS
ncbi:histidine phosphatase family protein [Hymenobacter rubripertinctus]|uniref:Alpha-ribazole phosphatase n=1 Tax=Hymenobacter rubripertinctus TaxID=2029981 RepID=A0A418QWN6_9BACT|nr:alpha-ribazole phosphatase family protein [Hymenobacter rubripertinctus]RIY09561.1 alpha-ribazole phosphatase [Hymenobacter rubripertinctus]